MSFPTVRLADLPIEWRRGAGLKRSDITGSGSKYCVLYGELFTKHKGVLISSYQLSKTNSTGKVVSKKGDIYIPATSTASKHDMILAREINEDDVLIGGDINIIRPKKRIFAQKYLPYFFETSNAYRQLEKYITGSTGIIHISNTGIKNLEIPFPPLEEQLKIVVKIDELFSEINKGQESIQKASSQLNVYKASLLDSAFKKIAEQDPSCLSTIGEAYNVYVGSTPKRGEASYWHGDINWVSSGEVAFRDIKGTKETISELGLSKTSTNVHPTGTVLLAMIGEGKTRGQAGILKVPAAHNQNTAAIRVSNNDSSEYLYYYLMSEYDRNRAIGSGNNQKALNKSRVQAMTIPLPSKEIQDKLVSLVSEKLLEVDKLLNTIQESKIRSQLMKQSVLSKAFKGELV